MVIFLFVVCEDQNGLMVVVVLFQFFKDVYLVNVDIVYVFVEGGNLQVRVYFIEGFVVNFVVMDEEILVGYFFC